MLGKLKAVGISGTAVVLALLLAPTAAHSSPTSSPTRYKDWSPGQAGGLAPVSSRPGKPTVAQPMLTGSRILSAGAKAGIASLPPKGSALRSQTVYLAPGQAATPHAVRSKGAVAADSGFSDTWCDYIPYSSAWPPPPASGNEYAMAEVPGIVVGYEQAYSSQGGTSQSSDTRTANLQFDQPISIGIGWPQPSQITGYVNPSFQGGQFEQSNISYLYSTSSASTEEKIQIGISRENSYNWETLWDIVGTSTDGTAKNDWWAWGGLNGTAFYMNIDSTPGHVYHFTETATSSATSNPVFFAGAVAQIDYGSLGLDAPYLELGNYFRANDNSNFVIKYSLPPGWTTSC